MRILVSVPVVAFSIVVGVAAQAQQQPAAPAGERQQPAAARAPAKVTVGGCIQNAPAAPAAQAAAAPASKFILANAKQTGPEGAAASAAPAAARYRLEGEEKAIATHLNHQVEVTGMVQAAAVSTAGAPAGPVLRVESVKMIADKCS